ncbi:MAG: hypothetical protein OEV42_19465 [Deltaproteobacteria bacterium]|nr:hypothetical protein [Deltaproteobacteria bacterium]
MANKKKRIDNPNQLTIFDMIQRAKEKAFTTPPRGGSLKIDIEQRHLVSDILKGCRWSRYEVAAKMSELTGDSITKEMLDSWTAESKQRHRFPAEYVPAFCAATENKELVEFLCRKIGVFVMPDTDALRAEIKRIEEDIKKKQKEKKKRETLLFEVEGCNET